MDPSPGPRGPAVRACQPPRCACFPVSCPLPLQKLLFASDAVLLPPTPAPAARPAGGAQALHSHLRPRVLAPRGQRLGLPVLLPQPQPLAVPGSQQGSASVRVVWGGRCAGPHCSRRATRSFPGARLSEVGAGAVTVLLGLLPSSLLLIYNFRHLVLGSVVQKESSPRWRGARPISRWWT